MAENKNKVIVYKDWGKIFSKLEDEEAGRLIKHFFSYVNDENPTPPDRVTDLVFEPIKQTLKRDLQKWNKSIDIKAYNARLGNLKRWNSDLYDKVISDELTVEEAEEIANHRKCDKKIANANILSQNIAVSDSVSVSDSVIVKKNNIINNSLLSEIKISDDEKFFIIKEDKIEIDNTSTLFYFKTALAFQKLFIKNLKEKNSPTTQIEKTKFKSFVNPIRLLLENNEGTKEQLQEAYKYLNSKEGEFWKSNILSTAKLREKLSILIAKKNTKQETSKTSNVLVPDPQKRKKIE